MRVLRSTHELRLELAGARADGARIGLVPTMGALHEGHLSLIRLARDEADVTVLSIFVNPLQFGPGEDFERYPRSEVRDLGLAEEEKAEIVFLPSVEEMYPGDATTTVNAGHLGSLLEGSVRPGHFDGVATVVSKLFNIVEPDVAVFGQKDAQQVAVVKAMVRDLSYKTTVVVAPIVREADGLALSSRNAYLGDEDRARAPALYRALVSAEEVLTAGGSSEEARRIMWTTATEAGFELDYAEVVDPGSFGEPDPARPSLLVIAGRLGRTRLIDNLLVGAGAGPDRGPQGANEPCRGG